MFPPWFCNARTGANFIVVGQKHRGENTIIIAKSPLCRINWYNVSKRCGHYGYIISKINKLNRVLGDFNVKGGQNA